MSFEPRDFLLHILAEADYLVETSRALDLPSFKSDDSLRRAFVRSLEIIGEASKRVPSEFQLAHPNVDWRGMAAMRDRLIHGYFAVDYDLVWDVVQSRIPELQKQIAAMIEA